MLQSAQIQRRQSEIRQTLSGLAANETPTAEQRAEMDKLDGEYRGNETRYRAALIAEDTERRDASTKLENREGSEWDKLVSGFELRQCALHLDEGTALSGATAEVVQELRSKGGYRGVPVPFAVLETRAGETVASGVPNPTVTLPIIDRLFPDSVAGAMGARMVNIGAGSEEWPITTSAVTAGWAASETGNVKDPQAYATSAHSVAPDHTLGVQMKITRKALKQSAGIEQAITRDLRGALSAEMDRVVFQGAGASGEPSGVIAKAAAYGITTTAIDAAATYAAFRTAAVGFMKGNAAAGPGAVRVLIRPEVFDKMDGTAWDAGSGITEFDRLVAKFGNVAMSAAALDAPTGTPAASDALLTTSAGGVSPIIVATWGAVDLIRDPYSDAQSGGLRLTALVTMDVTITRAAQLQLLTGLE